MESKQRLIQTPMPGWLRVLAKGIRLLPRGRYRAAHFLPRRKLGTFVSRTQLAGVGFSFGCVPLDDIAWEAAILGSYSPVETVVLAGLLKPGMRFVDVGANWGYFSLLAAALVGPTGRVIGLEPHPGIFQRLAENAALNAFSHLVAANVAATSNDLGAELQPFDPLATNQGTSRLVTGNQPPGGAIHVGTRILGELLREHGIGTVDVLKIDIEGGESTVIPTLIQDLGQARYKSILLELHPSNIVGGESGAKQLVAMILAQGYTGYRLLFDVASTHRAAYGQVRRWTELIEPFSMTDSLDLWPHLLLTAPGNTVVR